MPLAPIPTTAADNAEIEKAAEVLWNFLRLKECVAWIGSGLSFPEYERWEKAVELLCDKCLTGAPYTIKLGPDGRPDPDGLLELSDRCKASNLTTYQETLAQLYGRRPSKIRPAYAHLSNYLFRCRITTNVDPTLESVAGRAVQVVAYPDQLLMKHVEPGYVVYIHGIARKGTKPDGSKLVFCKQDMEHAYGSHPLSSFIEQTLLTFNTLFIGCRLGEKKIDNIFTRLKTIYLANPELREKQRRILVAEHEDTTRVEELGIVPIRYPKIDDNYSGLDEVLERLSHRTQTVVSEKRALEDERPVL